MADFEQIQSFFSSLTLTQKGPGGRGLINDERGANLLFDREFSIGINV